MKYNVSEIDSNYSFDIHGASYAGNPVSGTAMYITKKVEGLLDNLSKVKDCLVFIDNRMEPTESMKRLHCFCKSDNPQMQYALFMRKFDEERFAEERHFKYTLTDGGYYLGENVRLGNNAYIEAGCLIGHNVIIGDNAIILAGAVIKNAVIGDGFFCGENAVVGANGFTMAEDENGNKFRIPTLGRVMIGNNVEVGQLNSIAVGSGGDTVIHDNVKLDGLVHVGHNDNLGKNTEIPAGVIISGFVNTGEHSYIGVNSTIRNRIDLGKGCIIGMGAVVTKSVPDNMTVIGNPAREYIK